MINPYYTSYMLTHRFPSNTNQAVSSSDIYTRKVWEKLSDYGGSAYTYMRDLVYDPSAPIVSVQPVTTTSSVINTQTPVVENVSIVHVK